MESEDEKERKIEHEHYINAVECERIRKKNKEIIGRNVRLIRNRIQLSGKNFAVKIGISTNQLYSYEKGNTGFPGDLLGVIMTMFEITSEEIYAGIELTAKKDNTFLVRKYGYLLSEVL